MISLGERSGALQEAGQVQLLSKKGNVLNFTYYTYLGDACG